MVWRGQGPNPHIGGQERSDPGIDFGGQERSDPGIDFGGQERSDPGIDSAGRSAFGGRTKQSSRCVRLSEPNGAFVHAPP
jgi:hypothetical protein